MKLTTLKLSLATIMLSATSIFAAEFTSHWTQDNDRNWAGPDYWANRLQDWKVKDGKLICKIGQRRQPMRTVHLTTYRVVDPSSGSLSGSVNFSALNKFQPKASVGFLLGAGSDLDYRAACIIHNSFGEGAGVYLGVRGNGTLFINDRETNKDIASSKVSKTPSTLSYKVESVDGGNVEITLTADGDSVKAVLPANRLKGNLGIVSHPGVQRKGTKFSFTNWTCSGDALKHFPTRNCGPILGNQYTLSRGIMKMTAQLFPLGKADLMTARLQTNVAGNWQTITTTQIDKLGWTARFKVAKWDDKTDVAYRVVYDLKNKDGHKPYYLYGTVRKDPVNKENIVVAGFTGNHNMAWGMGTNREYSWTKSHVWFPHNDLYSQVEKQHPDLLFFSGDQVYENASPTSADWSSEANTRLDYLYKWYLFTWATRDLTKDIPAVTLPDDHDVFQGNIWGCGGRGGSQNEGGYRMSAQMVNIVQRTQTSHMPDAWDPTPCERGVGVYYNHMVYGRISFAILEDRKFKTQPKYLIGKTDTKRPDHMKGPNYDAKKADVPAARLLGERQLYFLDQWAQDWRGADQKCVLTQSVFANIATHHGGTGEASRLQCDFDSNGWPQTGRNKALREIRKGYALTIGGDQHLASMVKHGIDNWNDCGWALTVPSIANYYPRSWKPIKPGKNIVGNNPYYTGEHLDGFGNKMTVWAVCNPGSLTHVPEPHILNKGMVGYGIVRFSKPTGNITMEIWPRYSEASKPKQMYKGWPKTVNYMENYGKKAVAYLPTLEVTGMKNPVVQVIDAHTSEVIYTVRIIGQTFRPKVFKAGFYHLKVGELKTPKVKFFRSVQSLSKAEEKTLKVNFL